jgi:hypothetical protein
VATHGYVYDGIDDTPKMKLSDTLVTNRDNAPFYKKKEKPAVLTHTRRKQEVQQQCHWINRIPHPVEICYETSGRSERNEQCGGSLISRSAAASDLGISRK